MQLRKLALVIGLTGLFHTHFVHALGLGEISLKSSLNEPLEAEIRLLQVRDLSANEILVSLASSEDFNRVGVERVFFLSDLKFEVDLSNASSPKLKVTSRRPVREPYLNFLIETQWPSGRLLREYTVLMDLPVFEQRRSTPAPVQAPRAQPASRQPAQTTREVASPRVTRPSSTADSGISGDYRVASGDTLWEIALRTRPDRSVSVHQAMLAIQNANPDAFVNGNINRLRKGQVLRIPSKDEIAATGHQDAVSQVASQNQEWNNTTGAALKGTSRRTTAPTNTQTEGRLKLGGDTPSGNAKGTGTSGEGESLQRQLTTAQEELDRSKRENTELSSRVSDLEEQIETMEKLLEVSNEQLRALQLTSQKPQDEAQASTGESTVDSDETAANDSQAPVDSTSVTQDSAAEDTVATTDAPATTDPVAAGAPENTVQEPAPVAATPAPVEPAPAAPGIIDIIKDNIIAIGIALVALLVGLLAFLKRRGRDEQDEQFENLDLMDEDILEESSDDDQTDYDAFAQELDDIDIMDDIAEEKEAPVEAQTDDAVGEAEIYLSLGQYDKAEDLLLKEIQQNPDNADARMALLKVYAESQNIQEFDSQYAQLLPLGHTALNNRAQELRNRIPNAGEFDVSRYSLGDDDTGASADVEVIDDINSTIDDLDIDLDESLFEETTELTSEPELDMSSALSLNDTEDTSLAATEEVAVEPLDSALDNDMLEMDADDAVSEPADTLTSLDADADADDELSLDLDLDFSGLEDELSADLDADTAEVSLDMPFDLDGTDLTADLDDISLSEGEGDSLELDNDISSALDSLDDLGIGELANDMEQSLEETNALAESDLTSTDSAETSVSGSDDIGDISFELDDTAEGDADTDMAFTTEFDLDLDDSALASMSTDSEAGDVLADLEFDMQSLDTKLESSDDSELSDIAESQPLADSVEAAVESEFDLDLGDDLDGGELDLEMPPADVDMMSLDQEIEAMTADLDDVMPDLGSAPIDSLSVAEIRDDAESVIDAQSSDTLKDAEDSVFDEVLSNNDIAPAETVSDAVIDSVPSLNGANSASALTDSDDDLDFLDSVDEVATKLDLARAYIDMGDREGADDILDEVMQEGNQHQKDEATELKAKL